MRSEDVPLLSLFTAVLYVCTAVIGGLGLLLPWPGPAAAASEPAPVEARLITAIVPPQPVPAPAPSPTPTPAPTAAPPLPSAPPPPPLAAAPPMIAVAAPDPALSFAVPVESLTPLVSPQHAGGGMPSAPAAPAARSTAPAAPAAAPPAPPPIAQLTLGQGEGNQPLPRYPREALLEHQTGAVRLRFTVDTRGKVGAVDIVAPSPWPLLNQAAKEAVRDTWHFPAGPPRTYEVPIEFQLAH